LEGDGLDRLGQTTIGKVVI